MKEFIGKLLVVDPTKKLIMAETHQSEWLEVSDENLDVINNFSVFFFVEPFLAVGSFLYRLLLLCKGSLLLLLASVVSVLMFLLLSLQCPC